MSQTQTLRIDPDGTVTGIYGEAIDWHVFGLDLDIRRASHVEPSDSGSAFWFADLAPVGGPKLGPFARRSEALAAEVEWLECHVIERSSEPESDRD